MVDLLIILVLLMATACLGAWVRHMYYRVEDLKRELRVERMWREMYEGEVKRMEEEFGKLLEDQNRLMAKVTK